MWLSSRQTYSHVEVALQRPRGVGVADREGQVRDAAQHHALVAHRLGELDRAAVDRELDAAERQQVQAGRGDDQVGLELGAGREPQAVLGERLDAGRSRPRRCPSRIALNRSPSGTRHMRWSHGL